MLSRLYDLLTRPTEVVEVYGLLPFHGAMWPLVIVNVFFVVFAFRLGPWLMRNREPFNLKRVLMVYNVFQIIYNGIMVVLSVILLSHYVASGGLACIRPMSMDHPAKKFEIFCALLYISNKFIDYLETLFFILRKSYKQVTVLHVYHHIMMTTFIYMHIILRGVGGQGSTIGMLNALVHVVMYVYYLLSSIDTELKKSLWWKKYITQLQLVQFAIDFVHQIWPLVVARDCPVSTVWQIIAVTQAVVMMWMFGNFYLKTYIRKPKDKKLTGKQS
ncbi:elongation of very long chain fatty acids protein F-like [Bactrocera neohumeralis]|uniref:elongation of very long chain fatty acids protein F-like n=1 Tax=Bactrocera neohumeralis TaxID=98809 RepID=UPI0021654B5E|nr:elongation of very long chain fatty acids protein F-like [Bactrocera neohumeralis]